jgi:3-hydroxyisobutyrate dehydrogenase-like beta-hydroxyacid dehydrogenase
MWNSERLERAYETVGVISEFSVSRFPEFHIQIRLLFFPTMKTIGVLGLGIIGSVWARHYEAAGVLRGAWNRTAQPGFPKSLPSAEAVAAAADVIHIVVADPTAVYSVLEQIGPALMEQKIVVQSSTIDPESSEKFRDFVLSLGARYVEAPFTGSKPAAEEKQSVFFLGGDAETIAEVEPLLSLVSQARFHIGSHQQAATLKLALNLNIAAQMQGLAEALTMARKAGVSDAMFFSVMAKNVGYSGVTRLKEPKLREADFAPQFSVKHLLKDLRLASRITGCEEYPLLDTLREVFHHAAERGWADEDFSAIIKLLQARR